MIHQFGFVSEETFAEKMDTQNQFLAALVETQGGTMKPTSWANVQALVRAGLHKKFFAIGDQLVCQKGSSNITWDVIGIDHDIPADRRFTHSLTLQLHDCLPSIMQFDAPEALYYAESGLSAGTYNFTIQSGYDETYGGGKTYQFTIEQAVPAKGQLTFGWAQNAQAVNAKINIYANATSTTPVNAEPIEVTEGNSGTSLGTTDGTSTNLNHIHKVRYGSNNYGESAIRQFLNSSASAGSVWESRNKFDRPPLWNADTAGFMSDLDSDFLEVIGKSNKVTVLNTLTDGGGSVTLDDKFFLLSRSEVFGGDEVGTVDEGSAYPYYSNYSDLSAAGLSVDGGRTKYNGANAGTWWLRTPLTSSGYYLRYVDTTGRIGYYSAYIRLGIAPACNII